MRFATFTTSKGRRIAVNPTTVCIEEADDALINLYTNGYLVAEFPEIFDNALDELNAALQEPDPVSVFAELPNQASK
jgi:hypothetical protein